MAKRTREDGTADGVLAEWTQATLSSKMLLGAQRKLDHPLQQVIRRQARKIVQHELLGVETHEIAKLQRFAA